VTRYIGGSLCGCTAKGYWESLTESLIETGTNACNDDNNSCNYIFSGALNRYVFEGEGCSTEIVAKCHFAENGFTYCFPIYF
jgi:hypothetical protein